MSAISHVLDPKVQSKGENSGAVFANKSEAKKAKGGVEVAATQEGEEGEKKMSKKEMKKMAKKETKKQGKGEKKNEEEGDKKEAEKEVEKKE